jgi:hypothetical protein
VDHNFSDSFKIFGRYANTPSVSSSYSQAIKTNSSINSRSLTLGATNLITPTQANELRFNITQVNSIPNYISTSLEGATPFDVTTLPGTNGTNFPADGSFFQFQLSFGGYPGLSIGRQSQRRAEYCAP